ncbi:MAG: histidinol phosphate phosphatase [Burkholderiales bacterium]|nr:histidinol phosphate phosphatase [Burkholderiales bacterium]
MDFAADLAFACHLADLARPIARRWFRTPLDVVTKADASPVTQADLEIETALRRAIEARFPADGVLGEEHGSTRLDAARVWVIDPIDGTKAFTAGKPLFGTLIALAVDGVPTVGVIDQPISGERWSAAAGGGAALGDAPVHARRQRGTRSIADAVLATSHPDLLDGVPGLAALCTARFRAIAYGGDCYNYALLASGHIDVVIETGLKTVDFAALRPVIEAAGGVIVDFAGRPLTLASDGRVVAAADRALADEVLAALATLAEDL